MTSCPQAVKNKLLPVCSFVESIGKPGRALPRVTFLWFFILFSFPARLHSGGFAVVIKRFVYLGLGDLLNEHRTKQQRFHLLRKPQIARNNTRRCTAALLSHPPLLSGRGLYVHRHASSSVSACCRCSGDSVHRKWCC